MMTKRFSFSFLDTSYPSWSLYRVNCVPSDSRGEAMRDSWNINFNNGIIQFKNFLPCKIILLSSFPILLYFHKFLSSFTEILSPLKGIKVLICKLLSRRKRMRKRKTISSLAEIISTNTWGHSSEKNLKWFDRHFTIQIKDQIDLISSILTTGSLREWKLTDFVVFDFCRNSGLWTIYCLSFSLGMYNQATVWVCPIK